jgi:hypothetical protein
VISADQPGDRIMIISTALDRRKLLVGSAALASASVLAEAAGPSAYAQTSSLNAVAPPVRFMD